MCKFTLRKKIYYNDSERIKKPEKQATNKKYIKSVVTTEEK